MYDSLTVNAISASHSYNNTTFVRELWSEGCWVTSNKGQLWRLKVFNIRKYHTTKNIYHFILN